MAMSDCEHCWETPCSCGWNYRNESIKWIIKMEEMFHNLRLYREHFPSPVEDQKFLDFMKQW